MSDGTTGERSSPQGVVFTIPGVPVGKGRPRFSRQAGKVRTHTPEKTANYESLVKLAASQAMVGQALLKRPVCLFLTMHMPIPASWSKRRQELAVRGLIGATVKPDLDNVCKSIADAMNGIVYLDDKLIVSATIVKQYGTVPHVAVRVQEYAEKEAA
jgi:Holliday junction resolvase RusA-like endonuclease